MSKVYSILSNPKKDLELEKEFDALFKFLTDDKIKKKVDFAYSRENVSIGEITSTLAKEQKEISLFHFSGHSGKSGLDFQGEDFETEHVSNFFNQISKGKALQCVFLNGCENEAIVQKLHEVPVVIGTKSKIQDTVARKVTMEFFNSLIGGERTYEDAFKLALKASNIPDSAVTITRSESGSPSTGEKKDLNQYYIHINNKKVAEHSFAFKPKKTNWTKYLLLVFLAIALFLGWLFKDDIFKKKAGYDCSLIKTEEGKCNFVIADFTTDAGISEPSTWLYNNIRTAPLIQQYLHAINLKTFEGVIRGASIERESLPALCNYDFNLTGSIDREGDGYRAEFNIYPFGSGEPSYKSVPYSVSSLGTLDTLITYLGKDNSNVFVLYEMCKTCGMNKEMAGIVPVMDSLVEQYDPTYSTPTYQRLLSELSDVQLRYSDTTAAINSLTKITKAVGNDFALMAIERKYDLYANSNNIPLMYDAQTELVDQIGKRVQDSSRYMLSGYVKQYETASNKARLDRAMLVLKHKDSLLSKYKENAIKDFTHLQNIRYLSKDYKAEIEKLRGGIATNPTQPFTVSLQAVKMDSEKYRSILSFLKGAGYAINSDLTRNFNERPAQYVKESTVTYHVENQKDRTYMLARKLKEGTQENFIVRFLPLSPAVSGSGSPDNVTIQWAEATSPASGSTDGPVQFRLMGNVVTESGKPIDTVLVTFIEHTIQTNQKGYFDFGLLPKVNVIGGILSFAHPDYQSTQITITDESLSNIVLKVKQPEETPTKETIVIRAFQIDEEKYRKLFSSLKSASYSVDTKRSSNSTTAPPENENFPMVKYFAEEYAEQASKVADGLKNMFHLSFKPILFPLPKKSHDVPTRKNDIIIHWVEKK